MGLPTSYVAPSGPPVELNKFATRSKLTGANFESTLNAALLELANTTSGGTLLIPAGEWPMTSTLTIRSMYTPSQTYYGKLRLQGAGSGATVLKWPSSFNGRRVELLGRRWDGGGILDDPNNTLNVFNLTDLEGFTIDGGGTGTGAGGGVGLYLENLLFNVFHDVSVTNVQGNAAGTTGLVVSRTTSNVGAYVVINQGVSFESVSISGCQRGANIIATNTTCFYNCRFNQNLQDWDLRLSDTHLQLYNTLFQSPVLGSITIDDASQNVFTLYGVYQEGPGGTDNALVHIGNVGARCYVKINDFYNISRRWVLNNDIGSYSKFELNNYFYFANVSGIMKAKAGETYNIVGAPSPEQDPTGYEVDDFARGFTTASYAGITYSGSLSQAKSINGLLRPYITHGDIFDPSVRSTLTLDGTSKVTQMTGILYGNTATPPGGGFTAPQWVASSDFFGSRPIIQFAKTSNTSGTNLRCQLTNGFVVGDFPWMFLVARDTTGSNTGSDVFTMVSNGLTHPLLGISQTYQVHSTPVMQWSTGSTSRYATSGVATGSRAHAIMAESSLLVVTAGGIGSITVDGVRNGGDGGPTALLAAPFGQVDFLFPDTGVANLEIAYLAFGNKRPSPEVVKMLMDMAQERWGLAF